MDNPIIVRDNGPGIRLRTSHFGSVYGCTVACILQETKKEDMNEKRQNNRISAGSAGLTRRLPPWQLARGAGERWSGIAPRATASFFCLSTPLNEAGAALLERF